MFSVTSTEQTLKEIGGSGKLQAQQRDGCQWEAIMPIRGKDASALGRQEVHIFSPSFLLSFFLSFLFLLIMSSFSPFHKLAFGGGMAHNLG